MWAGGINETNQDTFLFMVRLKDKYFVHSDFLLNVIKILFVALTGYAIA